MQESPESQETSADSQRKESKQTKQLLNLNDPKPNMFIVIQSNDVFIGITGVQESFGPAFFFFFSTFPAGM